MRLLGLVLTCLCLSLGARAATPTTDFSDLWFNPNEEGWGATITQQNEILFITMFVYGPNNQPKWYVGPATVFLGASPGGVVSFSGPLYEATGPYFGAPVFDESAVAPNAVGTVTFAAGAISTGVLAYTVNNVPVSKQVVRQTWRTENISGVYVGASLGRFAGCGGSDGYFEKSATITIGFDGLSAVTLREQGPDYECNYQGAYVQNGRMGQITGTGSCTRGPAQAFIATEVQGGIQGISMRYGVTFAGGGTASGRMGGVRRGQ